MAVGSVTGNSGAEDPIIVVGAGLAGLVCAGNLLAAGKRVLLLEAADSVGGRVRTTVTEDGFRMDHGFQALFASYPALRRHVPIAALQPQYFAAGVQLMSGGRAHVLGHPIFNPGALPSAITSQWASIRDILALSADVFAGLPLGDGPLPAAGRSTRSVLEESGASSSFFPAAFRARCGAERWPPLRCSAASRSPDRHSVASLYNTCRTSIPCQWVIALPRAP